MDSPTAFKVGHTLPRLNCPVKPRPLGSHCPSEMQAGMKMIDYVLEVPCKEGQEEELVGDWMEEMVNEGGLVTEL